jgi:hypothetical protein
MASNYGEKSMNLEQFAKVAGVEIIECDHEWGGLIGYKQKDHPNCKYCGFNTEQAAYKHWIKSNFGEHTAKAVMKLLKPSNDKLRGAL